MTDIEKAIELLQSGSRLPDVPHTMEEVDQACRLAVQALQEKAENDKLREAGRLVVLPCAKEGADLFFVDLYQNEIYKEAYTNGVLLAWTNRTDLGDAIPLSVIGKSVFLSRPAAEKALEDFNNG